jgi:hypothetical protein
MLSFQPTKTTTATMKMIIMIMIMMINCVLSRYGHPIVVLARHWIPNGVDWHDNMRPIPTILIPTLPITTTTTTVTKRRVLLFVLHKWNFNPMKNWHVV